MMVIENHRLVGASFVESQDVGALIQPDVIVLHYTVLHPLDAVIRAFRSPDIDASAHLVLDTDGTWTQMVPFDRAAWHAGKSSWRGMPGLNNWSIGIEIVNPGPVFVDGESVRDVNDRPWDGPFVECPVPPGYPAKWTHWALYTEEQLRALEDVCRALVRRYHLREILGHSDVSPGRKFDPGPALPIQRIRNFAFAEDPVPIARPVPLAPPVSVAQTIVDGAIRELAHRDTDPAPPPDDELEPTRPDTPRPSWRTS